MDWIKNAKKEELMVLSDDEWKYGITADYILKNSGFRLGLNDILKGIGDVRFQQMDADLKQKFILELAKKISFTIEGTISEPEKCIIRHFPKRMIRQCIRALNAGDSDENIIENLVKE